MKRGFTLVELLGVIILLGLVGLIVIPSITKLVKDSRQDLYETQVQMIEEGARKWVVQNSESLSTTRTNYLALSDLINKGLIEQDQLKDPRNDSDMNGCVLIDYIEQSQKYKYAYRDQTCADIQNEGSTYTDYIVSEGVNKPKLAPGMTAVKWNGTTWETVSDPDTDMSWYNYANKEWANAKTDDGSFWVWIPRYSYQIASNYHSDVAGVINVKFLIDNTNENIDRTATAETATYSGNSQTNYVKHPAFTFGTTELTGIWVAKFEMSAPTDSLCYTSEEWSSEKQTECDVDTITPNSVPNVSSWRYVNIGNVYTAARNMENNSRYGWGTSGSGIDTHMMKNSEWGAVAYLFKSMYGKSNEIWINPSQSFITGCAGNAISLYPLEGCPNSYESTNGQQASTTGNIYGIYDMSGGAYEFVMGNYDNTIGGSYVSPNSISDKYLDIYSSYGNPLNIIGDAIYETSIEGESTAWFGDWSRMISTDYPWFLRGGYMYDGGESGYGCSAAGAGIFSFRESSGYNEDDTGFRTVVLVGPGL